MTSSALEAPPPVALPPTRPGTPVSGSEALSKDLQDPSAPLALDRHLDGSLPNLATVLSNYAH